MVAILESIQDALVKELHDVLVERWDDAFSSVLMLHADEGKLTFGEDVAIIWLVVRCSNKGHL